MDLCITRPDDWHLHLRDGEALRSVVPHTAARFARAIIMPNLKPPVVTVEQASAYRRRILAAASGTTGFDPLMTLYLTDDMSPREIREGKASGAVVAAKLYPAGVTTHSEAGVTKLERIYPLLEAMQSWDLPLLVHAEVADVNVDIFDREQAFIDRHLQSIVERFPELRVVFEHITTAQAVDFVVASSPRVAATITAHHLLYNRNAMLAGAIRPHLYCLPILKREHHRKALLQAAISGSSKFFLGTDSAPHPADAKESACGCAGCYTAHAAIELYAEAFEQAGALDRLEGFASWFGPDFYGLPRNRERVRLRKESWKVPSSYSFGTQRVVPLRAGQSVAWRLQESSAER